ncbi:MAG: uroporphyrinogen decarboxylase family protein, partial [Gemmatimonadota bacterium]
MTPREAVIANIEFAAGDGRIGYNFTGVEGRLNDFTGAGCAHGFQAEEWQEGGFDYYTDIWGNTWYRKTGLSKGGEVYAPVLPQWRDLDRLELPDLDNPAYYEAARQLGASGTALFRVGWLAGFPFAICRYMRKMEIYFADLIEHREQVDALHDRVTTLLEGVMDRYGEAGMDGVMFCEDLGTQERLLMSPRMWRDIFRPLYERLCSRAHRYGMKVIQHS